jgi:hypothetical protein
LSDDVQATNTWFVALVNDTADESAKMLTAKYSIAEVAYFRSLVRRRPTPKRLCPSCAKRMSNLWRQELTPSLRMPAWVSGIDAVIVTIQWHTLR